MKMKALAYLWIVTALLIPCGHGARRVGQATAAELQGPGGEYLHYALYGSAQKIPLTDALDLPSLTGEAFQLPAAGPTGAPSVSLLSSNGPHRQDETQYHPWPHVLLLLAPDDQPSASDHLVWTSRVVSEKFPPGARAALFRLPLSRNRATVGPQELSQRSGPGGGHQMYLGMHLMEDQTSPPRAVVLGEAYVERPHQADKPEIGDGKPLLAYYELGPKLRAAREIYYGDRIEDIPGVKSFWEQNAFIARGGVPKAFYAAGAFELVRSGAPSTLGASLTRLHSDPAAADFLHPQCTWVFGRDGFKVGDQTMLSGFAADPMGNLYIVGRTDGAAQQGTMNPYIVRMATDATITHRVFRLPHDLATFGFNAGGPIVEPDEQESGFSLYWAFTTTSGPLIVLRIDPPTLKPSKVVALKPSGVEKSPFAHSHFTATTMRDGKLYIVSNYRTLGNATRGFVLIRDAATLAPLGGFTFDSPLPDQEINIPLSVIPDPRSEKRLFLAGVAGRVDAGKVDQRTFFTYIARIDLP